MNDDPPARTPIFVIRRGRKRTKADRRFSKEVRAEREPRCEKCLKDVDREKLATHHVVEYAVSEPLRRERGNILVLCSRCHSQFSEGERWYSAERAGPYFTLPRPVRLRVLAFLREHAPQETTLIKVLGHTYDV